MQAQLPIRTPALLLLVLSLTACTSMGSINTQSSQAPSTAPSTAEIPEQWHEPVPFSELKLSSSLLDLIDNPELSQLEQTLSNNYDLRQTAIRVQQQRLLTQQTASNQQPELNLSLNSQRSKTEQSSTQHTLSLDMSWEIDVWGRLADQKPC